MRRPKSSIYAQIFGTPFWIFVVVAIATGWATWELKGPDQVRAALESDIHIFLFLIPRMAGGMILAGLLYTVLPPQLVSRWVGERSGLRGIVIASIVGALTPGGPMTSFPIVVAFYMSGADRGALVAYLTGWSLLGFQRLLVWELPLLGPQITLYRVLAVLLLPVLAGLIARRLPIGTGGASGPGAVSGEGR